MKIKVLSWAIVTIMTVVVMVQNSDVFFRKVPIGLNLILFRFGLAGLPVAVIVIGFFFAGYLVSLAKGAAERQLLKATVDTLREAVATQSSTLQRDVPAVTSETKGKGGPDTVVESANMPCLSFLWT